jgi:hypothetical protein
MTRELPTATICGRDAIGRVFIVCEADRKGDGAVAMLSRDGSGEIFAIVALILSWSGDILLISRRFYAPQ